MASQTQNNTSQCSTSKLLHKPVVNNIVPPAEECPYTQFYCEENVWRLCDYVRRHKISELNKCYVVFISNNARCIPLWRQRAGRDEEKIVTWDYHVIFMYLVDERYLVFDLDSDLPFPTYFHKYVTETLRTDHILRPENHRFFRVIPASVFLQKFASDRRHMRNSDGTWIQPPPSMPPIRSPESIHNIDDFISMDSKRGVGSVYKLQEFVNRFYKPQRTERKRATRHSK